MVELAEKLRVRLYITQVWEKEFMSGSEPFFQWRMGMESIPQDKSFDDGYTTRMVSYVHSRQPFILAEARKDWERCLSELMEGIDARFWPLAEQALKEENKLNKKP